MGQFYILGFIAVGGAFGACSRYLISEFCITLFGRGFPYGTLSVNVIGSFLMGL
ncbi:camphor resistance protein CrcB, partial [Vibrio xuii]